MLLNLSLQNSSSLMHFGDLGLPRALLPVSCVNSFFSMGFDIQIGVFWGAWGTIGIQFWDPGASPGDHFEGLGVPLGGSGAQLLPNTPGVF